MQSSTDSELLPVTRLAFLPDSQSLLEDFKADRRALRRRRARPRQAEVGVSERRSGAGEAAAPAARQERTGRIRRATPNLIVVADTDMLADPLWVRTQNVFGQRFAMAWANNGDFLANARRQPRGQQRPDQHSRPPELLPAVHQGRRAASARGRSAARQGEGARQRAEGHREEAVRARSRARQPRARWCCRPSRKPSSPASSRSACASARSCATCAAASTSKSKGSARALKVLNIALVPALLAIGAIVLADHAPPPAARRTCRRSHGLKESLP